jgi:tight adherence protein C
LEHAIAPLVFGSVFLLVLAMGLLLGRRPAERRLAHLSSSQETVQAGARQSMIRSTESGMLGLFRRIGERGERRQGDDIGSFRARFIHAGFTRPAAPAIFYGIRLSLALGLPVLAGLAPLVWGLPPLQQISLLCVLTAVGYVGPSIYLDRRVASRKGDITRALPDALDLMVVCVEAGLGINQSLARVAEEFQARSPVLSREFSLVGYETRAGKTTTEALRALAERTGVADVSSLVALLVQTERFGTSVAKALRVHAGAMRVRRMQRAEERAQKATLKLILPSTLIFAALLLIFLAPGMYNFFGAFAAIE